jgi:nitrate reductase beta subunit
MPMVWYIPPLSPVVDLLSSQGHDAEAGGNLFGAIDALRIPLEYLAELFTAGDVEPVRLVLQKLAAMRSYMRDVTLGRERDEELATAVGMTGQAMEQMYRLLAIAKYNDRYVIPKAHREQAHNLEEMACSVNFDDDPSLSAPLGESSGRLVPVAIESFAAVKAKRDEEERERAGTR